jgi:hypothetical protein
LNHLRPHVPRLGVRSRSQQRGRRISRQYRRQPKLHFRAIQFLYSLESNMRWLPFRQALAYIGRGRQGPVILEGGGRLGNGVFVVASPRVTVANMTTRNYMGNGVFFVASDHFAVVNVIQESRRRRCYCRLLDEKVSYC